LTTSTTLYVGNLSFYTTEEQVHALFNKCGRIKRIIMGLDRFNKTPCGFCFVEYYNRADTLACKKYLDGLKLDERYIRVDLDPGFTEGRQFGRGRRGGQVRDEFRAGFDPGRGGWGGEGDEIDGREGNARGSRRESGPSEHFSKRMRENQGNPRFREDSSVKE